jgi:hypothetical protein
MDYSLYSAKTDEIAPPTSLLNDIKLIRSVYASDFTVSSHALHWGPNGDGQ